MEKLETQVVVIGGGATGTAVLRDLAMRGFQAMLFERGNLSDGTTGNFHGLLHSGGRYAVKDPEAAAECRHETQILRRIAPQAIEDTGGFFITLDDDDEAFLPGFLEGCAKVDIPTEVISGEEARRLEPVLSPKVRQAVIVPDGSIDGWGLCTGNVASAKEHGNVRVFLYTPVTALLREGDRVVGVKAVDQSSGEEYLVHADYVVSATGPWAAKVAALGNVKMLMSLSRGTMVVLDGRPLKRVINRCRYPSDGDIIVPVGTTIVLGTTSVDIEDPDNFVIEEWEIDLMLDECIQMVPTIEDMRVQRSYASVRPLYQPPTEEKVTGIEVSRQFYTLDHEELDSVGGLITITGGKLTSSRLMAEKTVNLICAKMGLDVPCRTHLEPLPTAV
jgi:glycerol-3-phosphate dehydrogenase